MPLFGQAVYRMDTQYCIHNIQYTIPKTLNKDSVKKKKLGL